MNYRPPAALVAALTIAIVACAPVMPPPMVPPPVVDSQRVVETQALVPDLAVESPAPGGEWSTATAVPESDLDGLRAVGLMMPVKGVVVSKVEDSFDAPRDGGRRHDAVDILAPRGTPILAAAEGYILRIGTNSLGGNVIWTSDPEQKFVHYYAHLDRYAKGIHVGDKIMRGTLLGYVGTTGNAPPDIPHLHFQVMRVTDAKKWWDGMPVNPRPFLIDAGTVVTASAAKSP